MLQLVSFFVALSLLRRAPQDLPASTGLLALMLVANVTVGWFGTLDYFQGLEQALYASLMDAAVLAAMVFATLALMGKRPRFIQVITAFYGLGTLFGLVLWPLNMMAGLEDMGPLVALVNLIALGWIHISLGHVLRHALDLELWTGIVLATGYTLVGMNLIYIFFPVVTPLATP